MNRAWATIFLLFTYAIPSQAQTVANTGSSPLRTGLIPTLMNINRATHTGPFQIYDNIFPDNPGMNGGMFSSVIWCYVVSSNTCQDFKQTVWPTGFWVGASVEIAQGTGAGTAGITVATQAANTGGTYGIVLTFSQPGGAPVNIDQGGYIKLRLNKGGGPCDGQANFSCTTTTGATFSYSTDVMSSPPASIYGASAQSLDISAVGSGVQGGFNMNADDGSPGYRRLTGTYRMQFKAKLVSGSTSGLSCLLVRLGGFTSGNKVPALSAGAWGYYTFDFAVDESSATYTGALKTSCSIVNADVRITDYAITRVPDAANPTPFTTEFLGEWLAGKYGGARYMDSDGPMYGSDSDNMTRPMFARLRSDFSGNDTLANTVPIGLYDFMQLGTLPGANVKAMWYTIPSTSTEQDIKNYVDFVSDPTGSTTYGARRIALGQPTPYTSLFTVVFEFGNEVWNVARGNTGAFMQLNGSGQYGSSYGLMAARWAAAARGQSNFNSNIKLAVDGWQGGPAWTVPMLNAVGGAADIFDPSLYTVPVFNDATAIGGSGNTVESEYGGIEDNPELLTSTGDFATRVSDARTQGFSGDIGIYESNIGAQSGTVPQSGANDMVSLGAGLEHALALALSERLQGVKYATTFAFTGSGAPFTRTDTGTTSQTVPIWGVTSCLGAQAFFGTSCNRPSYLALQMLNGAIRSNMMPDTITGDNPTWTPNGNNGSTTTPAHYLQFFHWSSDNTQATTTMAVFNLDRATAHTIQNTGPNALNGIYTACTMTSGSAQDNNETSQVVGISCGSTTIATGQSITAPANSLTTFVPTVAAAIPRFAGNIQPAGNLIVQ